MISAPGGLEAFTQACRAQAYNEPHPMAPVSACTSDPASSRSHSPTTPQTPQTPRSSSTPRPSPAPQSSPTPHSTPLLYRIDQVSRSQGYPTDLDTSMRSEIPPSYSTIQSPESVPAYSNMIYNLRSRMILDAESLRNRLVGQDVGVRSGPSHQSGNPVVLQTAANTTQSPPAILNPSDPHNSAAIRSTCSGKTRKNLRCKRKKPEGAPLSWYCPSHKAQGTAPNAQHAQHDVPPQPEEPAVPKIRCSGTKKNGHQCSRDINAPPRWPWPKDDEEMPYFCHDHRKDINGPTGFRSSQTGEWIEYNDWICPELSMETKALLRQRMVKGPSQSDQEGYIYCYQVLQPEDKGYIHLKVGRSDDFVRRIGDWEAQCGKNIVLRGWFPGPPEDASLVEVASQKARVSVGMETKGRNCYMLERLIHLELMDVSEKVERELCGCGALHKEIFTFRLGRDDGKSPWEDIVKPIIEHWCKFVEENTLVSMSDV